jgi:hypothetical protein
MECGGWPPLCYREARLAGSIRLHLASAATACSRFGRCLLFSGSPALQHAPSLRWEPCASAGAFSSVGAPAFMRGKERFSAPGKNSILVWRFSAGPNATGLFASGTSQFGRTAVHPNSGGGLAPCYDFSSIPAATPSWKSRHPPSAPVPSPSARAPSPWSSFFGRLALRPASRPPVWQAIP